jgi:ABC-type multidrug transport system permease subunit
VIATLWWIARHDLALWLRSPGLIAASLLPAVGMGALVALLTLSIGMQPVALVKEGQGPRAEHMVHLLEMDDEAYLLKPMESRADAERALAELRVAAVLIIPENFDEELARSSARVELHLDNVVDVDLADDIRRTVTRSLAELDAPQLGIVGELHGPSEGLLLPNPFRVAIAEHDRRDTNVDFFEYELIPILVLIVISIGLLGTGLLVARDFERRTAKLFLLAPVGRGVLVGGRILGGVIVATVLVVPLVLVLALTGFMAPPPGHWPAVVALLAAVTLASVGMGVALGTWIRSTRLVAMVGLNAAAFLFFLGGGFSTVAFLPPWLQTVSRVLPTSYAISGLRQALFYPDLVGFTRDLSVLLGTAAATTALGALALARSWRRA